MGVTVALLMRERHACLLQETTCLLQETVTQGILNRAQIDCYSMAAGPAWHA